MKKSSLGLSVKSVTATHLVSVVREQEVILNGDELQSIAARGHFKSAVTPNPGNIIKLQSWNELYPGWIGPCWTFWNLDP